MKKEELTNLIDANFKTRREFIEYFNHAGGQLDESILSHQLSGRRAISRGWTAAYKIFFSPTYLGNL